MYKKALVIMALTEGGSLLSFAYPAISLPLLVAVALATFLVSLRKSEWGVYILFGELFFGSRGHLLEHGFLSLRLVIFVAVFVAWFIRGIMNYELGIRGLKSMIHDSRFMILYFLLLLVISFGIINGYVNGNSLKSIFNDANGYFYLAILPAVLAGIRTREAVENLFKILGAAVIIIAAKTLILFVWFSYGLGGVATLYHWVIDQDIGEITGVVGSASRIFMQSQFYALMGLFILSLSYFEGRFKILLTSAAIFSIVFSLSRSFWLGGIAGAGFAAIMLIFYLRVGWVRFVKFTAALALIAAVEIGVFVIMSETAGKSEAVGSRLENPVSEAAGGARLLLLPELLSQIKQAPILGRGFGRTANYKR